MTTDLREITSPDSRREFVRTFARSSPGMLVGGALVQSSNGSLTTFDPVTEEALGDVPSATKEDVDATVAAAAAATRDWRRTPVRERAERVRQIATVLERNREELAFLDAVDGGYTVGSMRMDVDRSIEVVELLADAGFELKGETIPATSDHLHYTELPPFGVVARIIPFNHPIFFATTKIAAPLVAGNCVVLKSPDQTPLSALRLGELLADVFPPGVLNIITGTGAEAGDALVRHPAVRRISFTGSEPTGRRIQRSAAESGVKMVTLELGGKNAMIVFPDADLSLAADKAVAGMNFLASQGQSCGSTSRLLLHRSIAQELTEAVAERVAAIRVGDPVDDAVDMGPLVSQPQYQRSMDYIGFGREDGARVVHGGGRPDGVGDRGFFVAPTVFDNVDASMRIAREEIFGPILSILTFEKEDEAIAVANDVEYGLTASVFTNDVARAHRVARELEAGYVWINETSRHFWGTPFGGVKGSGIGREEHLDELKSYTEMKAVHVPIA